MEYFEDSYCRIREYVANDACDEPSRELLSTLNDSFTTAEALAAGKQLRVTDRTVMNYLKELAKLLKIQEPVKSESSSITGMHVCVTGKLEKLSRKDVEKLIKSKGANFDTSVTSNTDILVTNDITSGSSKLNNARKYGTKIISEEELYELLNN